MSWFGKLFHHRATTHLPDQDARQASAQAQLDDATQLLAESREVANQSRKRVQHNHFTDGFAAVFEERRKRA